jgi:hypothetical protein
MVEVLTAPALLEPPFAEPLIDAAGFVSPFWVAWMSNLAGRVNVGNTGVTRAGPVTSDGSGNVSVTFDPPFLTAVVYVAATDSTGIDVGLVGITADATGFTAALVDNGTSAALPDHTSAFWAVGY